MQWLWQHRITNSTAPAAAQRPTLLLTLSALLAALPAALAQCSAWNPCSTGNFCNSTLGPTGFCEPCAACGTCSACGLPSAGESDCVASCGDGPDGPPGPCIDDIDGILASRTGYNCSVLLASLTGIPGPAMGCDFDMSPFDLPAGTVMSDVCPVSCDSCGDGPDGGGPVDPCWHCEHLCSSQPPAFLAACMQECSTPPEGPCWDPEEQYNLQVQEQSAFGGGAYGAAVHSSEPYMFGAPAGPGMPGARAQTCSIEALQVAGFRITTDTADDRTNYWTSASGGDVSDELMDICKTCEHPGELPDRAMVYWGAPIVLYVVAVLYSCVFHTDVWCCCPSGKGTFEPQVGRPPQPGDAKQRPLRKEAKKALLQYRYADMIDLGEQLNKMESDVIDQFEEKLAKTEESNKIGFFGKTEAVLEVVAFLAHLILFGFLLLASQVLFVQPDLSTDLTLEQCNNRPSPILQIEEPCENCPPIMCDPCQSMLQLYPMCDVMTGSIATSGGMASAGAVEGMMSMGRRLQLGEMGRMPIEVPQHLQTAVECSPCVEQQKCEKLRQEAQTQEMQDMAQEMQGMGQEMAQSTAADYFGDDPSFIERFALVQADLRAADCHPNKTRVLVIICSSVLTVAFMLVAIAAPACLPLIVILARTATKLVIGAMLMQPEFFPSKQEEPEDAGAEGAEEGMPPPMGPDLGSSQLEALGAVVHGCAALGILIVIYAVFRFFWEVKDVKIPNAVMGMIKPLFQEHKSALLKVWIPYAILNFVVNVVWNFAEVPLSTMVGCADLCSSVPSLVMTLTPIFWFVSIRWTSNFVTKSMYIRTASVLVRGDKTGMTAVDMGNVAVAAIVIPTVELVWSLVATPFSNISCLYGASFCCCCCDFCPVRRSILRYEANCLSRYQNFVLWRTVKDTLGFNDAALTQHADWVHPEKYAALDCRQHDLVCATLSGIPFVVGVVCAGISMQMCESKKQLVECYVTGSLIGSAISIPIEAAIDHVFGSMDDNIEDFVGREDFQKLVAIDDFKPIGDNVVAPSKPVDQEMANPTFESESEGS